MNRLVVIWMLLLSFSFSAYLDELKWPKGETFLTFLEKNKLPQDIYYSLDKEEQELASEIMAGVKYQILRNDTNEVEQVLIPIGEEVQMHLKKVNDKFIMEIEPIKFQREDNELALNIQSSPYQDIVNATNNSLLANEFAQSFKSDINLRNLKKGDKLVLRYQQKRRLGKQFGSIHIDVSMIETGKKEYYIFYYKDNYYDEKGQELDNFLLSNPVQYTRISSPFTLMRWHPILQKYRAHLGIDYAAPVGTPVRSAGTGKVTFAGNKGGYGNVIEIQHDSQYKTLYGHLNRFVKGLRSGQRVKQGQVIAYVGTTGMSTGPHLHFGLYRNNVAINPASVVKVAKSALSGSDFKIFTEYKNELKMKIQKAFETNLPPVKEDDFNTTCSFEKS